MLARFYSGLWIVKAEPKNLEAFIGLVKNLGMRVMLMRLSIVASHRTMRWPTCVRSNGVGGGGLKHLGPYLCFGN
jgi:hypothetical protein